MAVIHKEQYAAMNIHYRFYSLENFLDDQQKMGVTSIELHGTSPHMVLMPDQMSDFAAIRKEIEARGLKCVAFTPESVLYQYSLGASKDFLIEKSYRYFVNAIKAAKALGAKVMPLSCGGGYKDQPAEEVFKLTADALKKLAPVAEAEGITLAVETLPKDQSVAINTIEELKKLLAEVNSPAVKACMDICSVNAAGETMDQWFEAFGNDLVHVHLTDGTPAGRLVWGQGSNNLENCLQCLNKHGYKGAIGQNFSVKGSWVDWQLIDPAKGWVGTEFTPEHYWFAPGAASKVNFEAFKPYFEEA